MGARKLTEMGTIGMDELLDAVVNGTSGKVIDFKKPFEEIFKMFKRMDLLLYVQIINDNENVDDYKTQNEDEWFTFDELIQLKRGTTPIGLRYEPGKS